MKLFPYRPRAGSLLAAALACGTSMALLGAPAQAADQLSEGAERVRSGLDATAYAEQDAGDCDVDEDGGAVVVECEARESLYADYEFTVPRDAINFRTFVDHEVEPGSVSGYVRVDGYRRGRTTYEATVSVGSRTRATIERVRIAYDLPTRTDSRPCATPGEWAVIDVTRGGFGGSRRQVASVFDSPGRVEETSGWSSGYRYQVRSWTRCGSDRRYTISFHRYRDQPGWYSYWG